MGANVQDTSHPGDLLRHHSCQEKRGTEYEGSADRNRTLTDMAGILGPGSVAEAA